MQTQSAAESASVAKGASTRFSTARALLATNWWIVLGCCLIFAATAVVWDLNQVPLYRATASSYVTAGSGDDSQSAYQGSLASQQRVASYAKLVSSDSVVSLALKQSGLALDPATAKAALSSEAVPQTVLLNVSAELASPSEAAELANSASRALSDYVRRIEVPSGGGAPLAKLSLVNPAVVPDGPVYPRTPLNIVLGVLVGLVVGLVLSFVRSRLDHRVRSLEAVRDRIEGPLIGLVPLDPDLSSRGPIDLSRTSTQGGEAFRKIRTNLAFVGVDSGMQVISVTSAGQGDGKTSTAIHLAASLAEVGKNVLLMECDLRRPVVGERLGLVTSIGITSCISDGVKVSDCIQGSGLSGLDVLLAGAVPPNPAEFLSSDLLGSLIGKLRSDYEYVIIDSAPIAPVADGILASRWADGVLFVVREGVTRDSVLSEAISEVEVANICIRGWIMNGASGTRTSYGYY
ncbi:putative protein-tyrosine kinase [Gordonia polyisoprenivorans NBRC 16320 = JCM 10675]|nr:polysaccharide biosynthesis tyrosine autokinase [Gordonia polyisoprenivorans]GAB24390.1 putative protein-tyrosine kinase [Gordonia polyisoprenivorans NBRC 16320 = JCM 10675]